MVGAGMEPALEVLLQRALVELGEIRSASARRVLELAARRLDRDADAMVDDAIGDLRRAQLLGSALQAAAQTVSQQKIGALSRALANGLVGDEARIDEEQLVLDALAEIETPHIRVLVQLGPERSRSRTSKSNLRSRTAPGRGMSPSSVSSACGMTEPAARAALSVLQRAGLAARDETADIERNDRLIMELQDQVNKLVDLALKPPKDGRISSSKRPRAISRPGSPARAGWYITEFGVHCLAYLEDYYELTEPYEGGVSVE